MVAGAALLMGVETRKARGHVGKTRGRETTRLRRARRGVSMPVRTRASALRRSLGKAALAVAAAVVVVLVVVVVAVEVEAVAVVAVAPVLVAAAKAVHSMD